MNVPKIPFQDLSLRIRKKRGKWAFFFPTPFPPFSIPFCSGIPFPSPHLFHLFALLLLPPHPRRRRRRGPKSRDSDRRIQEEAVARGNGQRRRRDGETKKGSHEKCVFLPSLLPFSLSKKPLCAEKKHREEKRARRNAAKLLWLEWKTREGEKLIPFRHPCNIFPFLPIQTCYGEAEAALQLFDKCAQILAGSTVSIFQPVVFSLYIPLSRLSVGVRRGEGGERASLTMGKGKKNGRKGEEKREPLRIGRERERRQFVPPPPLWCVRAKKCVLFPPSPPFLPVPPWQPPHYVSCFCGLKWAPPPFFCSLRQRFWKGYSPPSNAKFCRGYDCEMGDYMSLYRLFSGVSSFQSPTSGYKSRHKYLLSGAFDYSPPSPAPFYPLSHI